MMLKDGILNLENSESTNNARHGGNQVNQLENQQEKLPQKYDLRDACVQGAHQNPNPEWARELLEGAHYELYDTSGHIANKVRMEFPNFEGLILQQLPLRSFLIGIT